MILFLTNGGEIASAICLRPWLADRYGRSAVQFIDERGKSLSGSKYRATIDLGDDLLQIVCLSTGALALYGPTREMCAFVLSVYPAFLADRSDVELCDKDAEFRVPITPAMDLDTLTGLFEDYE